MATGALMNTLSVDQGQSIPGVAHLVEIHSADVTKLRGEKQC